jgi:hypothetical protein
MSTRYNVVTPRPRRDGGTFWVRIGSAFEGKKPGTFNVIFDALPIPDAEGKCSVLIAPAEDRDQQDAPAQRQQPAQQPRRSAPVDDDIPF